MFLNSLQLSSVFCSASLVTTSLSTCGLFCHPKHLPSPFHNFRNPLDALWLPLHDIYKTASLSISLSTRLLPDTQGRADVRACMIPGQASIGKCPAILGACCPLFFCEMGGDLEASLAGAPSILDPENRPEEKDKLPIVQKGAQNNPVYEGDGN